VTDFLVEHVGDGAYDLVLRDTGQGDTDLVLVGNTEDTWPLEVVQRVTYALGTWLNESAFAPGQGFPWIEGVMGRQPIDGIGALIYQRIVEVAGVEAIIGQPVILLNTTTRVVSISVEVQASGYAPPIPVSFLSRLPQT
jgi:hypothetical protein